MSELHILDAGRADSIVLLLNAPQGKKVVVLDGGSCAQPEHAPLRSFLQNRGIREIDMAILTHLHQDHFGGFFPVVKAGIRIKKLLAPCGDLLFDERVYPLFGDREFYREYHQIFLHLGRQKTDVLFPENYAGHSFRFGDCALKCLFPTKAEEMESVSCAKMLCRKNLNSSEIEAYLERHKRACNADSSIWGLYKGKRMIALFTGDSPDTRIRQILHENKTMRPSVQKLSHHGLGSIYFSRETQAELRPSTLVVTIDRAGCGEEMRAEINALCAAGGSKAYYTYQGDFVYRF